LFSGIIILSLMYIVNSSIMVLFHNVVILGSFSIVTSTGILNSSRVVLLIGNVSEFISSISTSSHIHLLLMYCNF
jgi:hypothetical protein